MTFSCPHLANHLGHDTTREHDHRQPHTVPGGTSVTVRLRVTVPTSSELPDRVRLVVKERGALFFAYRRKLASVPFDSWTRLPNNVWQGSSVQQVAMNVPKLLKKAQTKLLSLKLYCLHRGTVQHKAVGSLERLLHQGRYQELLLDLHYPGCPFQVQATMTQAAGSDARRSSHSHEGAEEPQQANDVALDAVESDDDEEYFDALPGDSDVESYFDANTGDSDFVDFLEYYRDCWEY